jgi:CubicO group peptidase (beta-lactamase class C family)
MTELKFLASDAAADDNFGTSVAVSGDGSRVVVGAFGDDDGGSRSGSAYLFNGDDGTQLLKLVASDAAASDFFGYSVAVSGDGSSVVVGAYKNDDGGLNSGSAYLFNGDVAHSFTSSWPPMLQHPMFLVIP